MKMDIPALFFFLLPTITSPNTCCSSPYVCFIDSQFFFSSFFLYTVLFSLSLDLLFLITRCC